MRVRVRVRVRGRVRVRVRVRLRVRVGDVSDARVGITGVRTPSVPWLMHTAR